MFDTLLLLNSGWVLLFVRVILGIVMIYYGWPKIKDLKSNAGDFNKMGFRPGIFWGSITALLEFAGGIAMLVGFFAEIVAALFGIQMIVGAIWKATKTDKKFSDWSYDLQLLAMCLTILTFGAGPYAVMPLF
jgi:putative oxidoreductase